MGKQAKLHLYLQPLLSITASAPPQIIRHSDSVGATVPGAKTVGDRWSILKIGSDNMK